MSVKSAKVQKQEDRHFLKECIRIYRDSPALWNVKSKDYMDRQKKNKAYGDLLIKYKERYPDAEREDLKKRINTLRTNFRKELKKVADFKKQFGTNAVESYVPTLWYFHEFQFLQDDNISEPRVEVKLEEEDESLLSYSESNIRKKISESRACDPQNELFTDDTGSASEISNEFKTVERPQSDLFVSPICNCHYDRIEDYENIAKIWVNELRKIHPMQQIFVKKAINDILFEGQMGTLNRHSVVINKPSIVSNPAAEYT